MSNVHGGWVFWSRTSGEFWKFGKAAVIGVADISGGCGAMHEIHIGSEEFTEKRIVQQHQVVTQALSEERIAMHGLQIVTFVPECRS
uniref:Uncharacterized protein n=1 Tax=Varanus komodoensis TaxID=61221 RepID=A0A8D2JCK1_VARKO